MPFHEARRIEAREESRREAAIFAERFGRAIRQARERTDLTQGDLASAAGVAIAGLRKVEAGRAKEPSLFFAVRIADALGVSLDDLVPKRGRKGR
jgi:transcriptional regulator with XRE-family HTH domain